MAYEEVLMPSCFLGKKKYCGIPHEHKINFFPSDNGYFIKGLEVKKSGNTKLLKTIGMNIIKEALSIHNTTTLNDIVNTHLRSAFLENWDLDFFGAVKTYKPHKKNKSVLEFVARMKERQHIEINGEKLFPIPAAGEKIRLVVCKQSTYYKLNGNKHEASVGSRYEYSDAYVKINALSQEEMTKYGLSKLELDVKHYVEGAIIGMCARFVTQDFEPPERIEDYDTYKETDARSHKEAGNYLLKSIRDICGMEYDPQVAKTRKALYKKITNTCSVDICKLTKLQKITLADLEAKLYSKVTKTTTKKADAFIDRWTHIMGSIFDVNKQFGNGNVALRIERHRNEIVENLLINFMQHLSQNESEINNISNKIRNIIDSKFGISKKPEESHEINADLIELYRKYELVLRAVKIKVFMKIVKNEIGRRIDFMSGVQILRK
jgi:hypothetical protein